MIIAIAKSGKNALTSTNPNDFIFHSSYNTFKIIKEDTATPNITAAYPGEVVVYEFAHGLDFIPFVFGFCKFTGGRVSPPGVKDPSVEFWFASIGVLTNTIEFGFVNDTGSVYTPTLKYYACEAPVA